MTKLPAVMCVALSLAACKDKKADTTPKNKGDSASKIDATLCESDGKRVASYDLNKDGKDDVWRLFKGEAMSCKQVDFDHDARKDWMVAYDTSGKVLYQKADFDYDGKFDMSAVFDTKTTVVSEIERDTDFDGRYDVREIYDSSGALSSIRRDRNGDNKADQWEQYKETILVAILNDEKRLLPCACFLNGQYGFEGIYMGVPAILGKNGVERIVEIPLDLDARAAMQKTAGSILADVQILRDKKLM